MTVNQDFEDLYTIVKETIPMLVVKHGGKIDTFRTKKAGKP